VKPICLLVALAVGAFGAEAAQDVSFPGPGIELTARLYRPAGDGPFPAIVLMHGCSGMWIAPGKPTPSYDDWARRLQDRGFIAVLLDSFGPRGQKEICTQKQRAISEARDRPRDAYAALRWLATRADVRAGNVHLMGWSNGGSAVLNTLRPDAPGRDPKLAFRSAIAFYPGCAAPARGPYRPSAPLLIQAGGADDWTPAKRLRGVGASRGGGGRRGRDRRLSGRTSCVRPPRRCGPHPSGGTQPLESHGVGRDRRGSPRGARKDVFVHRTQARVVFHVEPRLGSTRDFP